MTTIVVGRAGELGPALREMRINDAMTQSALADTAGVGRQWLNAFEAGDKSSAPIDMVLRVIAALSVEVTLRPPTPERAADDAGRDLDDYVDLDALIAGGSHHGRPRSGC